MAKRRNNPKRLRNSISAMPNATKQAMLREIRSNRVIVGAYTDRRGGVCPMLAAHRNGGRTNLASFAKAWDRYTGAKRRPRPATEREVRTLRSMLEASLWYGGSEREEAAHEPRQLGGRRASRGRSQAAGRRADTGERSRLDELRNRA